MCKVYRQFILLLGMFLCTNVLVAAQTPAPHIVPAQERIAPITAMFRTAPARPLAGSLLRPENTEKLGAHFHYLSEAAHDRDQDQGLERLESLSQWREVQTLFSTRSTLPLVQLWGGRLRLDGFTSTLDMQNVRLGPSGGGGLQDFLLRRQNYPGEPRSVTLDGVSLAFHFGRNAQIGRPIQIWRCLARIAGALR